MEVYWNDDVPGHAGVRGIMIVTPHRSGEFQVCQYGIDCLKQIVPIGRYLGHNLPLRPTSGA